MKIQVISTGRTEIDADPQYQEPDIRAVIASLKAGGEFAQADDDVAEAIVDRTDSERSDISHDEYATVTEDDGTVLWAGWLTGDPDAPAPAEVTADAAELEDENPGYWQVRTALSTALHALQLVKFGPSDDLAAMAHDTLAKVDAVMAEADPPVSAEAKLAAVREVAQSWTEISDGWGEPTKEAHAEAEHGRQILAIIDGPQPAAE